MQIHHLNMVRKGVQGADHALPIFDQDGGLRSRIHGFADRPAMGQVGQGLLPQAQAMGLFLGQALNFVQRNGFGGPVDGGQLASH